MAADERSDSGLGVLLLLITVGMVLIAGLQAVALLGQAGGLANARAAQTATIEQATKLRAQLDGLAGKTAKLAEQGDADAKAIIDEMKRQGISVKPAP
jgi:hypothetical protein